MFQTPAASPDDFRAATVGQDVVLISETIGSTSVLEPVGDPVVQKFILRDTNIPIICAEAFMWDNAEWIQHPDDFSNEFSFFGNSGRTEDSQPEEIKAGLDSIFIKKPTHPIAGGVTGKLKVYNTLYSLLSRISGSAFTSAKPPVWLQIGLRKFATSLRRERTFFLISSTTRLEPKLPRKSPSREMERMQCSPLRAVRWKVRPRSMATTLLRRVPVLSL